MQCRSYAKSLLSTAVASGLILLSPAGHAAANDAEWLKLQASQVQKNAQPGLRHVPEKVLAAPANVSPELKKDIEAAYDSPRWYANHASSASEWQSMIDRSTAATLKVVPEIQKALGVSIS